MNLCVLHFSVVVIDGQMFNSGSTSRLIRVHMLVLLNVTLSKLFLGWFGAMPANSGLQLIIPVFVLVESFFFLYSSVRSWDVRRSMSISSGIRMQCYLDANDATFDSEISCQHAYFFSEVYCVKQAWLIPNRLIIHASYLLNEHCQAV